GACGGGGGGDPGGNTNPGMAPPTTSAAGTVLFNGAPLSGATVIAYSTNSNKVFATTTSDASGHYSFSGMGTACTAVGCIINFHFFVQKTGYAFNPVMEANPTGNRANYLWYAPAQNWYVNTSASVTRAGYNGAFTNPNGGAGIMFNVINLQSVPG